MGQLLKSCLCTQAQIESSLFQSWSERLRPAWDSSGSGLKILLHRKLWEWCFIAQALQERGMLTPGRRGLGFGVGREPLAALFAGCGCIIVATDLEEERARQAGWVETNQHAAQLAHLNIHGLCEAEAFQHRATFRYVDMTAIPGDLRDFDFTWSSCSFEHVGSIGRGQHFVYHMMDCMKPGGVGVHTTEFNLSSDIDTIDDQHTVLFRKRDIEEICGWLRARGHRVELDLTPGTGYADGYIDVPPYQSNPHLKLQYGAFVTTSIGLIIEKAQAGLRARITRLFRPFLRGPSPAAPVKQAG